MLPSSPLTQTGDNESVVSGGSSNSVNEDPHLHHHSSTKQQQHMKHEFEEKLKDNNNPYTQQNIYGKWVEVDFIHCRSPAIQLNCACSCSYIYRPLTTDMNVVIN